MSKLGLEDKVVDQKTLDKSVERFKERKIRLPKFEELKDPKKIPAEIREELKNVDPNEPHPLNLFRINWFNKTGKREFQEVPEYLVLPKELTGIDAKVVVMLGAHFPMVACHKVLAAYGCLAPRVITGQFDPISDRAIWPSTGNYCRGGVAVSRIMASHGVAILPEEMSQERFDWLNNWCLDPKEDIYATPGCESNVKEIYDKCNELDKTPGNIIFNQFCEFGNTLIHYLCTGSAFEKVVDDLKKKMPHLKDPKFFSSATGSAGTLSAGDYLKERYGTKIVAVEALECPTLLYNGFGGHNIQGIGDKHVPYVHNVMNTDFVAAVSDASTDSLITLFNTPEGRDYLVEKKGLSRELVESLSWLGISSICNILAGVKAAKYANLGEDDVVLTVATDSAAMYKTEVEKAIAKYFGGKFDQFKAAEVFGQHLKAVTVDHLEELTQTGKDRIFNLGYYTWVEQQGVELADFNARKDPEFWTNLRKFIPVWDKMIDQFNEMTGV